jgi:nucleoside diphosphate-linked moiety X motif protein 19
MRTTQRAGLPPASLALLSADRAMKKWRDASTVIVAARNAVSDFRVLTARRNVESSFMPNSHVFPGGALDPGDCGAEWERLHRALGIKIGLHEPTLASRGRLSVYNTPQGEHLPRYVSLRIAAVREAFEECGFLLCRRSDDPLPSVSRLGQAVTPRDTSELQKQLRDGGIQFHELCRQLGCFPDVWSLHEARNWLTPARLPKRFDTAFFLVCLERQPETVMDQQEVTEIRVGSR